MYRLNKQKIVIVVLAILLIAALIYIGITKYNAAKQEKEFNLMQQGALIGYQQAIMDLMNQAATCEQVPLYYNNGTDSFNISMIAVDCLQQTGSK